MKRRRKAVDEFVNEYLLNREAQKEGITAAELLERHVNSSGFKPPSEETLRVYYEGVDTTEPYEAVRDKIIEAIRTRRMAKARTTYLSKLREGAKVSFLLTPVRANISMKDTPVRGLPDAPVQIVEFADYECPYCQQIQPVVDKVLADLQGQGQLLPSRTSRFPITPTRRRLRKPRIARRPRENTGNSTTCSSRPGSLTFRN